MKNLKGKFYTKAAAILSAIAVAGVGIASMGTIYEPEMPAELKELD
ncbi:cyclic lactone autoinducer peptide [Desulfuribacillus alkaliarsenatis]|nr:cyclic lactone autoinducer peptide [Desulfuribacillus alkaliarsenatis]